MTTIPRIPFDLAVNDITGGNAKIQRRDYRPSGSIPIVDQGQEDVAGYTDCEDSQFQGQLPVILFGDHTRAFKYVDRPFALGADGVKVLAPKSGFLAKFLYYYFLSSEIPGRGYSRHFKFLRELRVPLFAPSEQSRIVELLDEADRLRRLRREADAKATRILPALFLKMFGDPVTNPMKWNRRPIGELGSVQTGNTPPRARAEFYGSAIEWIKSDNINTPSHYLTRASECLSEAGRQVGRVTPAGSTLVTCIAGSPECIGNAALSRTEVAFNQQINAVAPSSNTDPFFLYAQTVVGKKLIQAASTGAMKGMVSKSRFAAIPFLNPPAELQASFGRLCASILESLELAMFSGSQLEGLFSTLLERAFSGQLTATWRQAHLKELLVEMEHQARALNLPLPPELDAAV